MYEKCIKRGLDIILSLICIVILSIPMLIILLSIKLEDPGPALFRQKRVGIHKTYFSIIKFRSMRMDTPHDIPTHLLSDPDRFILKIGRVIRKLSIDELPQLFNILSGDMSFIGPRPALWNQYDLIEERDRYGANDVLPGLTGWAQINGRDSISIKKKAALDGEYVRNISFLFDCRCFFGSFLKVLRGDDIVEGQKDDSEDQQ